MPLKIIRPPLGDDKKAELRTYLLDHWERALEGRSEQIENYDRWERNYRGIPREEVRNFPWYRSSNFVVKLIRIFVDTFVARTLNIIFATRPLYTIDGFPKEQQEALQMYVNRKALYEWEHYELAKQIMNRGNKTGTAVVKVPWVEKSSWARYEQAGQEMDQKIMLYAGPKATVIPFEDFCVYPITANYLSDVLIKFHRLRYVEEEARQKIEAEQWDLSEDDLSSALQMPKDVRRESTSDEAGVVDTRLREIEPVECYLDYAVTNDPGKLYSVVALIEPRTRALLDCYFNPYPQNLNTFYEYKPDPREDFFYGESKCELLEQSQEETSQIHNDRRNNSYIANAPVFKRRSGSLLPNPSTNWYPGKVWDLEEMNDFEVVMIGRNYDPMLDQEGQTMQLAERLTGIGSVGQGYAAGMMGKRGIYNAQGTMAVMSESNQRQDTDIRDVREVLGSIARCSYILQRTFGSDDPTIAYFPEDLQESIKAAMKAATVDRVARSRFEVKTSNAGMNKEIEKGNLIEMAEVLGKYGATIQQMAVQLANPGLNPTLRLVLEDTVKMHQWMAARLLVAFDEYDAKGVLPDVAAAIAATVKGATGRGTEALGQAADQAQMEPGPATEAGNPLSRAGLQSLLAVPPGLGVNGGTGSMASGQQPGQV